MRTFKEETFTVFDLETSGGRAESSGILEIALVKIRGNQLAETYSSLVNPEFPIDPFVRKMTGIDEEMVAHAHVFHEEALKIIDFIDCDILVVHNGPFDLQFLNFNLERTHEISLQNPLLCTVKMGHRLVPEAPNRRLETLAKHLEIPLTNHHRALSDAEATAKIFLAYLQMLENKGVHSLAQLVRWMKQSPELSKEIQDGLDH